MSGLAHPNRLSKGLFTLNDGESIAKMKYVTTGFPLDLENLEK